MMADIYDFNAYRSTYLLRNFSRQANNVVHDLGMLIETNKTVINFCEEISRGQLVFNEHLREALNRINYSCSFANQCALAWNLDELDEMITKRDELHFERSINRNSNTAS